MDRREAVGLIEETFNNPFDEDRLIGFWSELTILCIILKRVKNGG